MVFLDEKDGFYQLQIWIPQTYLQELKHGLQNIRRDDPNFIKPKIYEITSHS